MDVVYVVLAGVFWLLDRRNGPWLRVACRRNPMTWLYVLGGIVSVGLLVYLVDRIASTGEVFVTSHSWILAGGLQPRAVAAGHSHGALHRQT